MVDKIEIYNRLGQLVKIHKWSASLPQISVEELPFGIYYVRMYGARKFLKSDKVIKQ